MSEELCVGSPSFTFSDNFTEPETLNPLESALNTITTTNVRSLSTNQATSSLNQKSNLANIGSGDDETYPAMLNSVDDSGCQRISSFSSDVSDAPLTVQPLKSPHKIATMTTVIDSQITRSDRSPSAGDKWSNSSAQYDDEDDVDSGKYENDVSSTCDKSMKTGTVVSETLVDTITTITKQPTSRPLTQEPPLMAGIVVNVTDCNKWDSFTEDVSASESMHSTSSSLTVVEATINSCQDLQFEDGPTVSAFTEDEQQKVDSVADSFNDPDCSKSLPQGNTSNRRRLLSSGVETSISDNSSDVTLTSSVPLDVSVESGGSSDTITTSMDSTQLAACAQTMDIEDTMDRSSLLEKRLDLDDRGLKETPYEDKSSAYERGSSLYDLESNDRRLYTTHKYYHDDIRACSHRVPQMLQEAMGDGHTVSSSASDAKHFSELTSSEEEQRPAPAREHSPSSSDR